MVGFGCTYREVYAVKQQPTKSIGTIKLKTPREFTKLSKVVYGKPRIGVKGGRRQMKAALRAPKAIKFKM